MAKKPKYSDLDKAYALWTLDKCGGGYAEALRRIRASVGQQIHVSTLKSWNDGVSLTPFVLSLRKNYDDTNTASIEIGENLAIKTLVGQIPNASFKENLAFVMMAQEKRRQAAELEMKMAGVQEGNTTNILVQYNNLIIQQNALNGDPSDNRRELEAQAIPYVRPENRTG